MVSDMAILLEGNILHARILETINQIYVEIDCVLH